MDCESDSNRLDRVRVRLRRCADRYVSSPLSARASSNCGIKGYSKPGHGTGCDDGCPCPCPTDWLCTRLIRHKAKRIYAGVQHYHLTRPCLGSLRTRNERCP